MTEETTTETTEQETTQNTEQQTGGKTYSDDDVNAIVVKKEAAARAKALKALGLTAEDETWAKETLAAAKAQKEAQKTTSDREGELTQQLTAAQQALTQATLEAQMLRAGVDPAKVSRAVRLVDLAKCSEDGKFSGEKAAEEVKAVLKEFPELAAQKEQDDQQVGLDMGGHKSAGGMTLNRAIAMHLKK